MDIVRIIDDEGKSIVAYKLGDKIVDIQGLTNEQRLEKIKKELPEYYKNPASYTQKDKYAKNVGYDYKKKGKDKTEDTEDIENLTLFGRTQQFVKKHPKITAVAGVALFAIPITLLVKHLAKKSKSENTNNTAIEISDYENLSLDELLNLLEDGVQKNTFKTIDETQDYFNNIASESIKIEEDNNAQLYLTSEEVLSLFNYANTDSLSKEDFVKAFGDSEIADESKTSENFLKASQVLVNYYRYAKEPSGIAQLFNDKDERKIFEDYENLVIEYNKNGKNKAQIQESLQEMFLSGNIDDLKSQYPGVASFVGTILVPSIYTNHAIDDSLYKEIVKINAQIVCENIKNDLKEKESACKESNLNYDILPYVMKAMDKANINSKSRNLNHEARQLGRTTAVTRTGKQRSERKSNVTTKKETIGSGEKGRAEAVQTFGEEKVSEAEKEAVSEFHSEYDVKNDMEKVYGQGLSVGYQITYRDVFNKTFQGTSTVSMSIYQSKIEAVISSYTGSYKDEYARGVREGAQRGYTQGITDGIKAREEQAEYINNYESTTTITEERNTEPTTIEDINEPTTTRPAPPTTTSSSRLPNYGSVTGSASRR